MRIGAKARRITPLEIGEGNPPVIFTHVGITRECIGADLQAAIEEEKKKIRRAVELGAHAICDVSTHSQCARVHEELLKVTPVPFGVVSVYETYSRQKKSKESEEDAFLEDIRNQIQRGADIITLHATVEREDRQRLHSSDRLIPCTSRGGILMLELLERFELANPYASRFLEILSLCREASVAVSLAPTFRFGSVADCRGDDPLYQMELLRMSRLVAQAAEAGVTIMIEGIGHAPIHRIPEMIAAAKKACPGAAYRTMPVSTDLAAGYDHISAAIAGAVAVQYGADSITCVTPKEHLGVPELEDVEKAVVAARIAAHSGYIARTGHMERDAEMSRCRWENGCRGNPDLALFPDAVVQATKGKTGMNCTMCGETCPLKRQHGNEGRTDGNC